MTSTNNHATPTPAADLSHVTWRKSSRSGGNGACVEVANLDSNTIAVRDSKNPTGPALCFTATEFATFLNDTKDGEFDHLLG